MSSELLLLLDLACIFLAAFLAALLYNYSLVPLGLEPHSSNQFGQAVIVTAVLAPFMLYDRRFGALASRGQMSVLVRSHALRVTLLAGVILALGSVSQAPDAFSRGELLTWFALSLLLTSFTRVLAAGTLRLLQRQRRLTEVIAVVGAGPVADRLVQALRQTRPETIELLGIFDDKIQGAPPGTPPPTGSLAQLIELGKTRKIDWILLTLPPTAEQRVLSIVQRLKALSVPIGLCPQHVGLTLPYHEIDYVADSVPVSLLADRPIKRWNAAVKAAVKAAENFLPRWIITLAWLPLAVFEVLADKFLLHTPVAPPRQAGKLAFQFDDYNLSEFTDVAASFGEDSYGYVVTPNADHMIRLHEDASFRALYAEASYILLDSRFLSHVLRISRGIRLPVCTGSDLTAKLFSEVISPDDPLVLIGGSDEQARQLGERYGLRRLAHHNPPMGFIHDPQAVDACLHFIEAHSPFRFCLLAVGAPQQEAIARQLKARGIARGLTLCIGASINFLTGDERRAPRWMQRCGMEWLFRLMQAPGRMAIRYLVRGPRVFRLLHNAEIVLRRVPTPVPRFVLASNQPALPVTSAVQAAWPLAQPVTAFEQTQLPAASASSPAQASMHQAHAEREDRAVSAST